MCHFHTLSFSHRSDNTVNVVARIITEFQDMLLHHPGRLIDFVLSLTQLTPNLLSSQLFDSVLLLLNCPEFLELASYAVSLYVTCMTFHNCHVPGDNNMYASFYAALEFIMHDNRHANAIARPSWLLSLLTAARTTEELNLISSTIVWPMFKNICLLVHFVRDLECTCVLRASCPTHYNRTDRLSTEALTLLLDCTVHSNDRASELEWLQPSKTILSGLPSTEDHYKLNTDGYDGPSTTLAVSVTHFMSLQCTSIVPNHSIGQQTAKVYASTTTAKPQVKITLPGASKCLTLMHDEPTGMFCAVEPVSDKSRGGFRDPDGVGVLVPSHFSILERHQDVSDVKMSEELLTSAFQTIYGAKPFHYLHDEHKKRKRVFSASGNHMAAAICSIGALCDAYASTWVSLSGIPVRNQSIPFWLTVLW